QTRCRPRHEVALPHCLGGTAHMTLEGFEIENWCCIRKIVVPHLPPTGVIVLHGPNRQGKSSIVQALRACLMDYASSSNSTAVTACFPRGRGEKPIVSVTFRANGSLYRITKHYGSSKSELASKTPSGTWKVETTTAREAHDRTCGYAGGNDSTKGLHQLLWLTQAEFHLPHAKKFDHTIQANLRNLLGVLQTPLDDTFIERVKKRWNTWFSGQRKAGKQHQVKDSCKLADNLKTLATNQRELQESEDKFKEVEGLLRQTAELDARRRDLEGQLADRSRDLVGLKEEHDRAQARISARQLAESAYATAEKACQAALAEQQQRAEVARRWSDDETAIGP